MAALVLSARLGKIAMDSAALRRECDMMLCIGVHPADADPIKELLDEARSIYKQLGDSVDGKVILPENIDQSYAIVKLIEEDWRYVVKNIA